MDDDVSAYRGASRPQYRQLLRDIEGGTVDSVVVWHLDRLHRQPAKEVEEYFEVCDAAQVKDLASVTGDVDLANDNGRLVGADSGSGCR